MPKSCKLLPYRVRVSRPRCPGRRIDPHQNCHPLAIAKVDAWASSSGVCSPYITVPGVSPAKNLDPRVTPKLASWAANFGRCSPYIAGLGVCPSLNNPNPRRTPKVKAWAGNLGVGSPCISCLGVGPVHRSRRAGAVLGQHPLQFVGLGLRLGRSAAGEQIGLFAGVVAHVIQLQGRVIGNRLCGGDSGTRRTRPSARTGIEDQLPFRSLVVYVAHGKGPVDRVIHARLAQRLCERLAPEHWKNAVTILRGSMKRNVCNSPVRDPPQTNLPVLLLESPDLCMVWQRGNPGGITTR